MPLRNRLLSTLTAALSGLLVVGVLATAPAPANAAGPDRPGPGKTYIKR